MDNVLHNKKPPFSTVPIDRFYASMQVIKHVEAIEAPSKPTAVFNTLRARKCINVLTRFSGLTKNKKKVKPFTSKRCLDTIA